jgi:Flp pilus assembly protein protease CpaA
MLEIIALVIAAVGSSAAAIWDLKTTEIPDEIPYVMIAAGILINGLLSWMAWDYWPILNSCIAGLAFLGFGFMMYYLGQWGGGDAKVLSAIGFLLPAKPSFINITFIFPFPFSYFTNVFLVGAAYMIVYAIAMAATNRRILREFVKDVKASGRMIFILSSVLFLLFAGASIYLSNAFGVDMSLPAIILDSLTPLALAIGILLIWRFVKVVEAVGFKRRISVRELKVGDVLEENRLWEGITEKELRKIRRSKKYVRIKEGVRFALAFPLALLVTLIVGDALFLFVKLFI